jgi:16S rRNA (adenine1518-N6/adenine1519-N6)-dimethyltransferase
MLPGPILSDIDEVMNHSYQRTDKEGILLRLRQAGTPAKKWLGQHFLINADILEVIVATAHIEPTDTVVEVGPGLGVLTEKLVGKAGRVLAFERDPFLMKVLHEDFEGAGNLEIIPGDALDTLYPRLHNETSFKVVANIPYQITSPLLHTFLTALLVPPTSLTLLVQYEVGERLAAQPGHAHRGFLSVMCQYYCEVTLVEKVSRQSFWPAPEVESAVVHLETKQHRLFATVEEEKRFLKFVRGYYIHPRKLLKNVVAGVKGVPTAEIGVLFQKMGWPDMVRAQDLSLEQWKLLQEGNYPLTPSN